MILLNRNTEIHEVLNYCSHLGIECQCMHACMQAGRKASMQMYVCMHTCMHVGMYVCLDGQIMRTLQCIDSKVKQPQSMEPQTR